MDQFNSSIQRNLKQFSNSDVISMKYMDICKINQKA
ncbi:unnamed protein product [Paramecium octaurelia]|uniref:Uncharacterized protein n=1 Tax=Paramecium octaurelia TaxID=43137 RepID=A0A8S1VYE5_PAROT|nr:unnamed protein product [Paramecium octaurelia]